MKTMNTRTARASSGECAAIFSLHLCCSSINPKRFRDRALHALLNEKSASPIHSTFAGRGTSQWIWLHLFFWFFLPGSKLLVLNAQPATPDQHLYYMAQGNGLSTGNIATLYIFNPSPQALKTIIGDCFIPSINNYQGYVVLQTYPVLVPAFGTAVLQLQGYCTNVQSPAVPAGETMPGITQWVSWTDAEPMPTPDTAPASGFYVLPGSAAIDPLALRYPGSETIFPYRIDFNEHPRSAARLLLHAAYAAEKSFDQLVREGKIRPAGQGRTNENFRREMVQQAIWAYAVRLEGKTYNKNRFKDQFTEEVEQLLNQGQSTFPAETEQQINTQTDDLWSDISLVGTGAKLIPVSTEHPVDVFKESPSGPIQEPVSLLLQILENTDPNSADAAAQLIPAQLFLQKNDSTAALQSLKTISQEKWRRFLSYQADQVNLESESAVQHILVGLAYLESPASNQLSEQERRSLSSILVTKLNSYVKNQVNALKKNDPVYLKKWRRIKGWQSTRWYASYCAHFQPMKTLAAPILHTKGKNQHFKATDIQLSGPSWKLIFPPTLVATPKKFPWWIPITAVPLAGGLGYWLLRDKSSQPPPATAPDALTMACGSQSTVDLLINDTGEGIAISSLDPGPGISMTISGTSSALVMSQGLGIFTASYTIIDKSGKSAIGSITVTVADQSAPQITCPASISLEGCDLPISPSQSGVASATDDCDAAPLPTFFDELGGSPCDRIVIRTWVATDASGKSASCSQTISVRDQTAPLLTCPASLTVPLGKQNDLGITGQASATDVCSPAITPSFSDDLSGLGDCSGSIIRTWQAADDCSNTSSCTQAITVVDDTAPTISCPAALTVGCGDQYNLAITGQATVSDNCSSPVNPVFTDNPPLFTDCSGSIDRSWTGTDASGNSTTCLQVVSVQDQTPPVLTFCPTAITVILGQQNDLSITGEATAMDACLPVQILPDFSDDLSGFDTCGGVIIRTWTAMDSCANTASCIQTINVVDGMPPSISCPDPVAVECGMQNDLTITGQASASDDCSGALNPTYSDSPPQFHNCAGTIIRTWTATDPGGNTVSCAQEISVTDNSPPVFSLCPPAITVPCEQATDLGITGIAQASDACNGASAPTFIDNNSGYNGCQGVIVRTFSSMDSCGNIATCTQSITVFDNSGPVFTPCPQAITVNCGQENQLSITGEAMAKDSCSGAASVTYTDDISGFIACEGTILRDWLATDLCGNTSLCQQTIMVENVPCSFSPQFIISPDVCGNCNGQVNTSITPPGDYAYLWDDGYNAPNRINLCAGSYSLSITDNINNCTDIFTVEVPDVPILTLTILQEQPPSSPSSNDGWVLLQVSASAQLPLLKYVNNDPVGTANSLTFQVSNLAIGAYEIWVVDQGGLGCQSNSVFVEFFTEPTAKTHTGPEIEWLAAPANIQNHNLEQEISALLPEQPSASNYAWEQPLGIAAAWPITKSWQMRLGAARQNGLLQFNSAAAIVAFPDTWIPVQMGQQTFGIRRLFPINSKLLFFQESGISHQSLRLGRNMMAPYQSTSIAARRFIGWDANFSGGLLYSPVDGLALELSSKVAIYSPLSGQRQPPSFQLNLNMPIRLNPGTLRLP